jgi:hypothetical protein
LKPFDPKAQGPWITDRASPMGCKDGAADGTRTRDPRRDRPVF